LSDQIRVNRLRFNNDIYTYGTGFSFQLGAIAKVTKELRLGLSYDSPTWYRLNDELQQSLVAVRSNADGEFSPDIVDPQIIMVYETYKLQTPGKVTGSIAYIFGKEGLISFDLGLKDYSGMSFRPKNQFRDINNEMSNILQNTVEYRIGAEKRIKQWSLRAGYRMEESPYKNTKIMGDLTGYSGGIGYNFGSTKLDLSYSHSKRDYQQLFVSQGLTDAAKISSVTNNVSLTLLFEL
jgi:long-subunit fatty acid transport protein